MIILGIESSCDETAACLLEVKSAGFTVVSNVVWSQTELHKKYGGVVPEIAARAHVEAIIPVIQKAVGKVKPDIIAVTKGPGLITALQVGVQAAKTLSYVWHKPLIGVNHLEGHLWSFLLNKEKNNYLSKISFPVIALIVSGGHTELILVKGIGKYKLIGQTLDDAAGEAFDKVAKMLNLGYPGGPVIARHASKGNKTKITFPRPMLNSADFDFSFSGLKTSVKYYLRDNASKGKFNKQMINDVCASFQAAVIDVLSEKTIKAAKKFNAKVIILGGGVSANEELINSLQLKTSAQNLSFYYPERWLTGDNAAMVALAGYFNKQKSSKNSWKILDAEANLRLVPISR